MDNSTHKSNTRVTVPDKSEIIQQKSFEVVHLDGWLYESVDEVVVLQYSATVVKRTLVLHTAPGFSNKLSRRPQPHRDTLRSTTHPQARLPQMLTPEKPIPDSSLLHRPLGLVRRRHVAPLRLVRRRDLAARGGTNGSGERSRSQSRGVIEAVRGSQQNTWPYEAFAWRKAQL